MTIVRYDATKFVDFFEDIFGDMIRKRHSSLQEYFRGSDKMLDYYFDYFKTMSIDDIPVVSGINLTGYYTRSYQDLTNMMPGSLAVNISRNEPISSIDLKVYDRNIKRVVPQLEAEILKRVDILAHRYDQLYSGITVRVQTGLVDCEEDKALFWKDMGTH